MKELEKKRRQARMALSNLKPGKLVSVHFALTPAVVPALCLAVRPGHGQPANLGGFSQSEAVAAGEGPGVSDPGHSGSRLRHRDRIR